MDFTEVSDWIWLAVLAFWLLGRVLPKLFRRERKTGLPQEPRHQPEPTATERLRRGDAPKPIVPH